MLLCHLGVLLATPRSFQQLYKEGCRGNGSLPRDIAWIVHDPTTVARLYAALSRSCRDPTRACHSHFYLVLQYLETQLRNRVTS
ncbi:hypothetical protein GHT06_008257 [Daphnia sinensis]|uniref:Uncharacterized protein n=1 Tax=Daphnia sinensis TaxID=1820382 RepID=A0AAD5LLK5_9CRUS|nr:hypothetical protein GHT06_008257 [Daphnia sinensis]